MIRYEDGPRAGNGHRVRMMRLCSALMQRGLEVNIGRANFVEILDKLKRERFDVLVMDMPKNNNRDLEAFRPHIGQLAVVVGVGHSVNTETSWIADQVIYQNARRVQDIDAAPGAQILGGVDYLMVDPFGVRRRLPGLGQGIVTYFGVGFSNDYTAAFADELRRLMPDVEIDGVWREDWTERAAKARLVVASMGMAVNEAVAARTHVVTVSVDEEHAVDARALRDLMPYGVVHTGKVDEEVSPEDLAATTATKYKAIIALPLSDTPIDGMGVYRVAELML